MITVLGYQKVNDHEIMPEKQDAGQIRRINIDAAFFGVHMQNLKTQYVICIRSTGSVVQYQHVMRAGNAVWVLVQTKGTQM